MGQTILKKGKNINGPLNVLQKKKKKIYCGIWTETNLSKTYLIPEYIYQWEAT